MKDKKTAAIIPARASSERVPGKNLVPLNDKPLIAWTIEAALGASCLDHILVTSDDPRTLNIAREYGVSTLRRPGHLATSTATTFDTLANALDHISEEGMEVEHVMLLQPTSPLRSSADIDSAHALLCEAQLDSVISVCPCEHPPQWTNTLDSACSMDSFLSPDIREIRSQDLPRCYRLNGALYIARVDGFILNRGFFMKNSRAYVMPLERSIDIDTKLDFAWCEFFMSINSGVI